MKIQLQTLETPLSVCRVTSYAGVNFEAEFFFIGKTDEENSLVCATADVPETVLDRDDGWRAFRIVGVLDFSLIGILAGISGVLADSGVGIFAISTYNTDYVLTKADNFDRALAALQAAGYEIVDE